MEPIISMQDFTTLCGKKCFFSGYVWDTKGNLFHVDSIKQPSISRQPDYPNQNRVYTNGTSFHGTNNMMTITLKEIGIDDVVYDEKGSFICTKQNKDINRKGEIYIRRKTDRTSYQFKTKGPFDYEITFANKDIVEYEDIPLRQSTLTLSLEAYSKIFTHILSLDPQIKEDLSGIRNRKVSIQFYGNELPLRKNLYNMEINERDRQPSKTIAFQKNNLIVAVINVNAEKDYCSTIWNVLNILGVHELGHFIYPWWNDVDHTHFLNYLYQMGHYSWDKTTKELKDHAETNLNIFYQKNRSAIFNEIDSCAYNHANTLYNMGIYPAGTYPNNDKIFFGYITGKDSIRANERIAKQLQQRTIPEKSPFEK